MIDSSGRFCVPALEIVGVNLYKLGDAHDE
jgi:hypothetical protein